MSKSGRRMGSAGSYVVAALMVVLGVGAGGYLASRNSKPQPPPAPVREKPHVTSGQVVVHPRQTVEVYVINTVNEESTLVPVKQKVPADADRYEAAMDYLLKYAGTDKCAIPAGTRLKSLEIGDGIATVNLSKQFVDNFAGGSQDEMLAVNAIVQTVAQFGEVKKVVILVDGKKIPTLGGHLELDEPIDINSLSQQSVE
jgi:spore germination protein GerM